MSTTSVKLIVAYPQPKDVAVFDEVYQKEHVSMAVAKLGGKTKIVATKVLQSPQGTAPLYCIAEVHFPSMEALQRCVESTGGKEIWPMPRKSPLAGLPLL